MKTAFNFLIKYFGKKTETDHGVFARPSADWHCYLNGEECHQRTFRLRFMREKEITWSLLWFTCGELLNELVDQVSAVENAWNPITLQEEILKTGASLKEMALCLALAKEWLGREICYFSWRGFTISTDY